MNIAGPTSSIKKRFLFSVGANIARAIVSLLVGLLVARGLGPAHYGNLAYLLGSFWAIRALLDMGTSSAFFTFIARRRRDHLYYFLYFGWLVFQFFFSIALVSVFLPATVVERFWLGQEREMILLAFVATFLQNQVWQTLVQMHESERKTIRIQIAGLSVIGLHLMLVAYMFLANVLSIQTVLLAIVAEYLLATVWLSVTLRKSVYGNVSATDVMEGTSIQTVALEYFRYCRPMIVIAVFTFFYEMADRWLLQRFGGANQQGFYQVASQLSTISLLATSSILNIFWKEIAEATERGDSARVAGLYQKTTQLLIFLASLVSCFLAPWAEQLVDVILGSAYHAAWPVLLLMLFYPIHQAIGQINGTLFMATGRNSAYMKITVAGLLASIPVSYVLIAPTEGLTIPGLGLGAMGLALKIVGLNIVFVNIRSWMIARHYGFSIQWRSQVSVVLLLLAIGYGCMLAAEGLTQYVLSSIAMSTRGRVLIGMVVSGLVYLGIVFVLLNRMPVVAGMTRSEVAGLRNKLAVVVRGGKELDYGK